MKPDDYPVRQTPDWVCEVSHSTWRKDITTVYETLEKSGVGYYWLADVERRNLLVFALAGTQYSLVQRLFPEERQARIPPFDAIALNIAVLFGLEDDEDERS